ncbi:MAG: hypothetical protein RI964_1252 [Pseudomonadota bacterium]|jgi:uncharacterized protein
MLNRLPVEVNPFRLVEQRKCLTGILPSKQMPRLADVALEGSEDVSVKLEFVRSPHGLPMIDGYVRGRVVLECQRCLQPVQFLLDAPIHVALTTFQSDDRAEQEGLESWLVEDERLFIQDFVEDEILLALPFVAKHEQCEPARPLIEAVMELPQESPVIQVAQVDEQANAKKNPFAVLKDWKKTE